ncbi:hypothetical protein ACTFIR_006254 [Dictyostelium discoideum]
MNNNNNYNNNNNNNKIIPILPVNLYGLAEKTIMKQINQVRKNKKSNNQDNNEQKEEEENEENEEEDDSDGDESDDMYSDDSDDNNDDCNNIIKCTCDCLTFSKANIKYLSGFNYSLEDEKSNQEDGLEEEEDEAKVIRVFRNEWLHFLSIIANHNSLESLIIGQECDKNGDVMEFSQRKQRSKKLSDVLIKEFGSMISSIEPLRKLSILGLNSDQLIRYISSINKTITKYYHVETIRDDGSYAHDDTPTIQSILVDNPQITDLEHTKHVFSAQKLFTNDVYNGAFNSIQLFHIYGKMLFSFIKNN